MTSMPPPKARSSCCSTIHRRLVRAALARALASSEHAPPVVILGLAADQPDIARCRAAAVHQLLSDADLVDAVATGQPEMQTAIAQRAKLYRRGVRPPSPRSGRPRPAWCWSKMARGDRAMLARPDRGAFRPSRRDPRGHDRARGSARADASGAVGKAFADARRHGAGQARRGSRAACGQGSLREGDRQARRRSARS